MLCASASCPSPILSLALLQQPQIILLKEGTDTSQGTPQLVSNINACMALADTVRTTLGPRGMDKLIHDDKVWWGGWRIYKATACVVVGGTAPWQQRLLPVFVSCSDAAAAMPAKTVLASKHLPLSGSRYACVFAYSCVFPHAAAAAALLLCLYVLM